MKKKIEMILLLFVAVSCSENYISIPKSVEELFVYREGDTFLLQEIVSKDTVAVDVFHCVNEFQQAYMTKDKYQLITLEFKSFDNSFIGYLHIDSKGYPVEISLTIKYNNVFDGILNDTLYNHILQDKKYDELYIFSERKGKKPLLYFTKEEGIVYIDSLPDGSSYSLIEYVKGEDGLE